MYRFVASLVVLALSAAIPVAAQKPLTADEKALAAYRLTMPTVKKVAAATAAFAEEEKKNPDVQEIAKLKAEIDALEAKDELSDADEARLEKLRERLEAVEEKRDKENSLGGSTESISEMEARIRKYPAAMAILNKEGLTPREYSLCLLALLQASIIEGFSQGKADLTKLPPEVNPENVKFVREHKAELEALTLFSEGKKK